MMRCELLARAIGELEPGLPAVGPGQPAKIMIERPVLHHQHDECVDRQLARRREPHLALAAGRLRNERVGIEHQSHPGCRASRDRGPHQELPPGVERLRLEGSQPLRLEWIPDIAHTPDTKVLASGQLHLICERING